MRKLCAIYLIWNKMSIMKRITIGTRASKLAMIQTHWVAGQLRQQWPELEIEIVQIRTTGDRITNMPLSQIGGDGVFVTEIEHALQERRIDLAVHSLKDLPTAQPDNLRLIVMGPREDVRDVLVTNVPVQIVDGQLRRAAADPMASAPLRIGTCSLRRTAQIRAICPDVEILPLRGNVDTRLRKLDAGEYDAIVLASAGLHRLGLQERLAQRLTYFPAEMLLPAPGQGALALEIRDEPEMRTLLAPLNDLTVEAATSAERMFMRRLGAGCYLPVAAYGAITANTLTLHGLVTSLDGTQRIYVHQEIPWPPDIDSNTTGTDVTCRDVTCRGVIYESAVPANESALQLGINLAEQALAQGAHEIIREIDAIRTQEQ
jgi:hydroxymethylbilane synthase